MAKRTSIYLSSRALSALGDAPGSLSGRINEMIINAAQEWRPVTVTEPAPLRDVLGAYRDDAGEYCSLTVYRGRLDRGAWYVSGSGDEIRAPEQWREIPMLLVHQAD